MGRKMVKHFGNDIRPLPLDASWHLMREALDEFEPDFQMVREQPAEQAREALARTDFA
jgi:antitoxin VapB